MNRVVFQEGYTLPFDAYKRKRRSSRSMPRAVKAQQSKMKGCARKWRSSGTGSYRAFMKRCLSK